MVGVKTTATTTEDMSYMRKIRKPMVEKKRRERMNSCITQLKSLIAQTIKQHAAPMTRVDKADILELTVFHLAQLQQQQQSVNLATEAAAYKAGYSACAREATTFLSETDMNNADTTRSLSNHLDRTMLQQNTAQIHYSQTHTFGHKTLMGRISTPLRPYDSFNSPLPGMNSIGYSPIENSAASLPDIASPFIYQNSDTGSSIDFSSSYSTTSQSGSDSSLLLSSDTDYVANNSVENKENKHRDVVTIGDGKENEVGHVIKEIPWRPF